MLAQETLSFKEWISVLKLATMWQMDRLHQIAFQKITGVVATKAAWIDVLDVSVLHGLSDVQQLAIQRLSSDSTFREMEKVLLARKYKVESWLKGGCRELVTRKQYFSDEEDVLLGLKTVSKLYRLREEYREYKHSRRYLDSMDDPIEREFGVELMEMKPSTEM